MDKNISRKIPRREANYLSLQEWIKKKKIQKKLNDGVSALSNQYRQGNFININTAKNEINKLISASNPKLVLYNSLIKYAITPPIVLKRQEQRLGKLSKAFEKGIRQIKIKTNKLKYYLVSCLLFTNQPKYDINGNLKKPDYKDTDGKKYWIINNYQKDDWRAYRYIYIYIYIYIGIPFDFPEDFIKNILLIQ